MPLRIVYQSRAAMRYEEVLDRDIQVQGFPVNANAAADQGPSSPLVGTRFRQFRKEIEGNRQDLTGVEGYPNIVRIELHRRYSHVHTATKKNR